MRKVSVRHHYAESPMQAGKKWDNVYVETPFRYGRKPSQIAKRLAAKIRPASTVIELGGGYGRDAVFLAKRGHNVISLDISEEARMAGIYFAKQEGVGDRIVFITKDVSAGLELGSVYANAVFANLFFNLVEPEQVAGLLKDLGGLLIPGGRLLFGLRTTRDVDFLEGETVFDNVKNCSGFTCYFYDDAEARELFMGNGFSSSRMEHTQETVAVAGKETTADLYIFELVK
jgi:SAM-dependent methyltransferase